MFQLFHWISLLVGDVVGLAFGPESSVRHRTGADESDVSGAMDPEG